MKIPSIFKAVARAPFSLLGKLVLTPLEKPMNKALQAALTSTLKKVVRTLLATAGAALLSAIPAMQAVFQAAADTGGLPEQVVFGIIIAGLVGASAFVERFVAAAKNGQ